MEAARATCQSLASMTSFPVFLTFNPPPFVEETERPEIVAETSRAMNNLGSALVDSQREARIWCFKAEKKREGLCATPGGDPRAEFEGGRRPCYGNSPSEEASQTGYRCRDT
ncbi:hypothetical protein Rs2_51001 [Raphanus sativus]|nr:hypothetical protein Rs2_51001 [Raphanus sativus]